MDFKRIIKHLVSTERSVRQIFKPAQLEQIENAIRASESSHSGEIRFAVESSLELQPLLKNITPRQRAIDVFSDLHVWDTELNNGVLIYILLADHAIEIVADRGIHAKLGTHYWEALCSNIQAEFKQGNYAEGTIHCINEISNKLIEHFPMAGGGSNELPDTPVVIG